MAKTKISEWSTTPASNTDIDGINIAEGCAPSGINDAIRDLMAQVRSWQSGASGDPFNGPMNGTIGATTAYSGAFTTVSATGVITSTLATGTAPLTIASTTKVTNLNADLLDGADWASPAALGSTTPAAVSATTLSASGTVSGTGFSNYLASPPAIGGTTAAAGSFTTLTTSSTVTLNGGTANGVTYLNGSKVLTSGSALTFDGTNLGVGNALGSTFEAANDAGRLVVGAASGNEGLTIYSGATSLGIIDFANSSAGVGTYAGFLQYNHSANALLFGTSSAEQMRLTSTGLGIGTSSPAFKLDLNGVGAVRAGQAIRYYRSDNAIYTELYDAGASGGFTTNNANGDGFRWQNGSSTTVLTLNSSGNLGLGVTPSAWSFGKAIEVGFTGKGVWANNQNEVIYPNNAYYNGGWKYSVSSYAPSQYAQRDGLHAWYTAASGTAGNAISFTQAMTLDASGNLLVGTTSTTPANTNGSIIWGGTDAGIMYLERTTGTDQLRFYVGGNRLGYLNTASSAVTLGTANYPLVFATNDTERARIDSSGAFLVGKMAATYTTDGVSLLNTGSNFSYTSSTVIAVNRNGTDGTAIDFYKGGTQVGSISVTGSATAYNTSSDYRLKNTITPMTGALAKVALLKPCTYKWNADGSDGEGFIAHELAEVCPDAVTGEKDAVDEEGNPKYQGIDTSFLVATLTAAIQEQQAIIESLKARLDAANL